MDNKGKDSTSPEDFAGNPGKANRAENSIRDSDNYFRDVADNAPVMIWITAADASCTYLNSYWYEFTGQTPEEALGFGWLDAVHPDDREKSGAMFLAANEKKESFRLEYRLRRRDGEYLWAIDAAQPRFDENGEFIGYIGSVVDINERKKSEEKLRESENRYRTIFNTTAVSIWEEDFSEVYKIIEELRAKGVTDFKGYFKQHPETVKKAASLVRIKDVNAASLRMFRAASREELLESLEKIFLPETYDIFEEELLAVAEKRSVFSSETKLKRLDGKTINILFTVSFPAEDAELKSVMVSLMDITERKKAENALRESEARFHHIADAAPVLIWISDTTKNCTWFNKPWLDFTGREMEEEIGGWTEGIHPEDLRRYLEIYDRNFDNRTAFSMEYRLLRHDGEYRWLIDNGVPRFAPNGDFLGFIGSCIDVTESKQTEDALRESEEKFRNLADNMSQFAWMADRTGWIFWYNRRWFEYTGTTIADMQGWGWQAVHHPDHVERVKEHFKNSIETGKDWEDTFPLRSKTGEFRWFLSRAMPIRDGEGNIVRWFGTNTDIEELREAKIQAESANRLKDEFLATVSHELRTPLNAIMGWATMARQSGYDEETMRRALEIIERNARNQNQIISDILDVSRIITGKLNLEMRSVELPAVIRAAVDTVRPAIDAKNIHLKTRLEDGDKKISGDPDRLQQIIWNLLSNAVKFTPDAGEVEIALEYADHHAEITVADSGDGIAPEFLPFVFDRFRQADGKMNRKHGGLGLGLAIVRHLAELHGGTVGVENAGIGGGANFRVRLPLYNKSAISVEENSAENAVSPPASENGDSTEARLDGLKILVVDDEPDALHLIAVIFSNQGAEVSTAETVDEALKKLEEQTFDLLVSDIGMPEKDGYFLIEKIKNFGIPAIALTAYAGKEDRERALQSGFRAYLPKPAEPSELLETVLKLIRERGV